MQFSLFAAAFFAVAAMANPVDLDTRGGVAPACPAGLFSVAQCCTTIVLGVAALDCVSAPVGTNAENFLLNCELTGGREAGCCVLPILGQDLLCEPAPLN